MLNAVPLAMRPLFARLAARWQHGSLTVILPSGVQLRFGGTSPGRDGIVELHSYRTVRRVLASGGNGFADGYIDGEWDSPDLTALLEALVSNSAPLGNVIGGTGLARFVAWVAHRLNHNSRAGSRRNILAHYDLGNDFFERWLDPTMTYSSARFASPDLDLAGAQVEKYANLVRMLDISAGHNVLEIGCGWGGFTKFVATRTGAHITGVTISRAQFEHASAAIQAEGLGDRVALQLVDYRDIEGRFDRIASIEMFEAVGEAYWAAYFAKLQTMLAPNGRAGLQMITIRDDLFDTYRRKADFVQRHIFPGGMLPSPSRLAAEIRTAGLAVAGQLRFGADYARTLAHWRDAFDANWAGIATLGFDDRFRRLWRYYLAYSEAGFVTGRTDVVQVALARG
jgi:cyclopropane-fatty-acyl-phospholipid synthase